MPQLSQHDLDCIRSLTVELRGMNERNAELLVAQAEMKAEMRASFGVLSQRQDEFAEKLEGFDKHLFKGNGTPALVVRVARLEDRVTEAADEKKAKGERWHVWAVEGFCVLLASILAYLFAK